MIQSIPTPLKPQSLRVRLSQIEEVYRNMVTVQSGFTQVYWAGGTISAWRGGLSYAWPDRARWETAPGTPEDAALVSDGTRALARQDGIPFRLDTVPTEDTWPWLFDALADLQRRYVVDLCEEDDRSIELLLEPRLLQLGDWDHGRVRLSKDGYRLSQALFWQDENALVWIRFENFQIDPVLPDGWFRLPGGAFPGGTGERVSQPNQQPGRVQGGSP